MALATSSDWLSVGSAGLLYWLFQYSWSDQSQSKFGYFGYIYSYLNDFINQIIYFPPILLIGEGFSGSFGKPKGGDIGFMESVARLGMPFFIISVFFFYKL